MLACMLGSSELTSVCGRLSVWWQVSGLYCTGWVKRGPSGIINTNIMDARETVAAIVEDAASGVIGGAGGQGGNNRPDVVELLPEGKRREVVTWEGYRRIDAVERSRGEKAGKPREKMIHVKEMLSVALNRH